MTAPLVATGRWVQGWVGRRCCPCLLPLHLRNLPEASDGDGTMPHATYHAAATMQPESERWRESVRVCEGERVRERENERVNGGGRLMTIYADATSCIDGPVCTFIRPPPPPSPPRFTLDKPAPYGFRCVTVTETVAHECSPHHSQQYV